MKKILLKSIETPSRKLCVMMSTIFQAKYVEMLWKSLAQTAGLARFEAIIRMFASLKASIVVSPLILAILAIPAHPDQISAFKFRGLNNNENSVIIDPSDAQDLLNVDVTPGGQSVKKRQGYGLYKALGTAQAIHGGTHFFDSNGNDVQVWGSSTSLYGIVSDGTPTQLISSATLSSTWDCSDAQGSAYCVNSNRNAFVKTSGAAMTWYASPLGTMVETTPDRVVVAGVSGTPNTLYFSQSNVFTNFAVGLNSTDPFQEIIAAPGSRLTHIRWACGKLLWWKDQSVGTMDFDDQFNISIKTVSDTIGTFDNTSAVDPGGSVWFRGQDGHTYKYDCSFITRETIDISPTVEGASRRVANSWTQTSASDFNNGSGYATFADTTTSPGSVVPSGITDQFTSTAAWLSSSGTWTVTGDTTVAPAGSFGTGLVSTLYSSTNSMSNSFYAKASMRIDAGNFGLPYGCFGAVNSSSKGYWACLFPTGAPPGSYVLAITTSPATLQTDYAAAVIASVLPGTGVTSDFHTITLSRSTTGFLQASFDGLVSTNAMNSTLGSLQQAALYSSSGFDAFPSRWDYIYLKSSTGTYYSAVNNAVNFSTWSTLGANYSLDGGSQTYYVRAGGTLFSVLSTTPAWVLQSAGNLISASTGTFMQFRSDFTTNVATATNTLSDFTLNWFEGAASDQAYMLYFDNAIWESIAFGSGQSVNNYIVKKDLINDGWMLYGFGANGMAVQNNALYFGDPSLGNIFNFGSNASDNGAAINAFWKSKDFTGTDPFFQNQLMNIDVFAEKDQGSSLTATYTLDTLSSTSYAISLSTSASIIQSRKNLPSGKLGYAFNYKVGDTSASSAWEVFGWRISFSQLPYRVSP